MVAVAVVISVVLTAISAAPADRSSFQSQRSRQAAVLERRVVARFVKATWSRDLPIVSDSNAQLTNDGTAVIVDMGSALQSFSVENGSSRWRSSEGLGSPVVISGGSVFCLDKIANQIVRLDGRTGHITWRSGRLPSAVVDQVDPHQQNRLLVSGRTIVLISGGLYFIVGTSRHVVESNSQELGIVDPNSAKQIGSRVLLHHTTDWARIVESVAEYDSISGQRIWESQSDASQLWIHGRTAIIVDVPDPTPPFSSNLSVTLEFHRVGGKVSGSDLPPVRTYSPDASESPQAVFTRPSAPVYIAWPNLFISSTSTLYRYDLRRSPDAQPPDRVDNVDPAVGMFDNGTLVVPNERALRFVKFDDRAVRISSVRRRARLDTEPYPEFIRLGNSGALTDASGRLLIFGAGDSVVDITRECGAIVSATALSAKATVVVCADRSSVLLKLFRS